MACAWAKRSCSRSTMCTSPIIGSPSGDRRTDSGEKSRGGGTQPNCCELTCARAETWGPISSLAARALCRNARCRSSSPTTPRWPASRSARSTLCATPWPCICWKPAAGSSTWPITWGTRTFRTPGSTPRSPIPCASRCSGSWSSILRMRLQAAEDLYCKIRDWREHGLLGDTLQNHPLDAINPAHAELIERNVAESPFHPWDTFGVIFGQENGHAIWTNAVTTYYHYWQALLFAEILPMGISVL